MGWFRENFPITSAAYRRFRQARRVRRAIDRTHAAVEALADAGEVRHAVSVLDVLTQIGGNPDRRTPASYTEQKAD